MPRLRALRRSFDNSGHRISFPQWHSNSTNVARTDAIIKRIASLFVNDQDVVTVIAPLNEYVHLYVLPRSSLTEVAL